MYHPHRQAVVTLSVDNSGPPMVKAKENVPPLGRDPERREHGRAIGHVTTAHLSDKNVIFVNEAGPSHVRPAPAGFKLESAGARINRQSLTVRSRRKLDNM